MKSKWEETSSMSNARVVLTLISFQLIMIFLWYIIPSQLTLLDPDSLTITAPLVYYHDEHFSPSLPMTHLSKKIASTSNKTKLENNTSPPVSKLKPEVKPELTQEVLNPDVVKQEVNPEVIETTINPNTKRKSTSIIDFTQNINDQCNKLNMKSISETKIGFITPDISRYLLNRIKGKNFDNTIDHAPYLASYPGSGNTFTRLGIEYITQYYTSSVYTDQGLVKAGYKGESVKNTDHWNNVICIKIHPGYTSNKHLFDMSIYTLADTLNIGSIFIQRHPYDALFTQFEWLHSSINKELNMFTRHTAKVPIDKFENELIPKNHDKFLDQFVIKQFLSWDNDFENVESLLIDSKRMELFVDVLFENLVNVANITAMTHEWVKIIEYLFDKEFLNTKIEDIIVGKNNTNTNNNTNKNENENGLRYKIYFEHLENMLNINNITNIENFQIANGNLLKKYTILDVFKARIQCFLPMNKNDERMMRIHRPKENKLTYVKTLPHNGGKMNQTVEFVTKKMFWDNVKKKTKCDMIQKYKIKMSRLHYEPPPQWGCNV